MQERIYTRRKKNKRNCCCFPKLKLTFSQTSCYINAAMRSNLAVFSGKRVAYTIFWRNLMIFMNASSVFNVVSTLFSWPIFVFRMIF